jgi:hypothetical protein
MTVGCGVDGEKISEESQRIMSKEQYRKERNYPTHSQKGNLIQPNRI